MGRLTLSYFLTCGTFTIGSYLRFFPETCPSRTHHPVPITPLRPPRTVPITARPVLHDKSAGPLSPQKATFPANQVDPDCSRSKERANPTS